MTKDDQRIAVALEGALSSVGGAFAQNELAYLALTSKAELPVRDRVAWNLQMTLGKPFVVSREWRRADIAVLLGDVPLVQVEAKALYAFDVLSGQSRGKFLAKLTDDGLKMASLVPGGSAFLPGIDHARRGIDPTASAQTRGEVQQRHPSRTFERRRRRCCGALTS
jgi:hypothetical protein